MSALVVKGGSVTGRCLNRFTVIGPPREIQKFERCWIAPCAARYVELLEVRTTRMAWQFKSEAPPLEPIKNLSARQPRLTLLLDYAQKRIKGLVRARKGKLTHYVVKH